MQKPLVSVHIITYCQIDFIHETLISALEQDYENLEVVVADDGSTDGTVEVILEYAKKYPGRLIPLVGGENLGITGNSNRAWKACRGKYVALQGGDDVLYPGKISKQVEWMEADVERVMCGHDVEVFDSATREILGIKGCGMPELNGSSATNIIKFGVPSFYSGTSIMVKKSALPSYGFDERLPVMSDWKFLIDCVAAGGKYGAIEGLWAGYRKHGKSITDIGKESIFRDAIITVGIVEAQYPQYLSLCPAARAAALFNFGTYYLFNNENKLGKEYLLSSAQYLPILLKLFRIISISILPKKYFFRLHYGVIDRLKIKLGLKKRIAF